MHTASRTPSRYAQQQQQQQQPRSSSSTSARPSRGRVRHSARRTRGDKYTLAQGAGAVAVAAFSSPYSSHSYSTAAAAAAHASYASGASSLRRRLPTTLRAFRLLEELSSARNEDSSSSSEEDEYPNANHTYAYRLPSSHARTTSVTRLPTSQVRPTLPMRARSSVHKQPYQDDLQDQRYIVSSGSVPHNQAPHASRPIPTSTRASEEYALQTSNVQMHQQQGQQDPVTDSDSYMSHAKASSRLRRRAETAHNASLSHQQPTRSSTSRFNLPSQAVPDLATAAMTPSSSIPIPVIPTAQQQPHALSMQETASAEMASDPVEGPSFTHIPSPGLSVGIAHVTSHSSLARSRTSALSLDDLRRPAGATSTPRRTRGRDRLARLQTQRAAEVLAESTTAPAGTPPAAMQVLEPALSNTLRRLSRPAPRRKHVVPSTETKTAVAPSDAPDETQISSSPPGTERKTYRSIPNTPHQNERETTQIPSSQPEADYGPPTGHKAAHPTTAPASPTPARYPLVDQYPDSDPERSQSSSLQQGRLDSFAPMLRIPPDTVVSDAMASHSEQQQVFDALDRSPSVEYVRDEPPIAHEQAGMAPFEGVVSSGNRRDSGKLARSPPYRAEGSSARLEPAVLRRALCKSRGLGTGDAPIAN